MKHTLSLCLAAGFCFALAGCVWQSALTATPTVDPEIYSGVPDTTVFEPGQCSVVLSTPAPAYAANTLGRQSSGEIAAGTYQVAVAAHYKTSTWYKLYGVDVPDYINTTSVAFTSGNCRLDVD